MLLEKDYNNYRKIWMNLPITEYDKYLPNTIQFKWYPNINRFIENAQYDGLEFSNIDYNGIKLMDLVNGVDVYLITSHNYGTESKYLCVGVKAFKNKIFDYLYGSVEGMKKLREKYPYDPDTYRKDLLEYASSMLNKYENDVIERFINRGFKE